MIKTVSIIGDGAMGTVLGMLLCSKNIKTRIWGYDAGQLEEVAQSRENKKFLPGHKLPTKLEFEADDSMIMVGADLIISAVPCQYIRSVWNRLKPFIPENVPVVSVTKGIENDTLLRPTQIIEQVTGRRLKFAVLSGPTIADEIARRLPATACIASANDDLANRLQRLFAVKWFRVYTNTDILGVELAAATKNVIAIAAGIIDGTKAGDNAKAALLCRGLAEISRLGSAMGAKAKTFSGLTGLGDLVTTCISPSGRNRSFGERVGGGQTAKKALAATHSVVEGVATCSSVVALSKQYKVDMPITRQVHEIIFVNKPVKIAIAQLMERKLKAE